MGHQRPVDTSDFVKLSAQLTGFGADRLYATGLAGDYRDAVIAQVGSSRLRLLVEAGGQGENTPGEALDGELDELSESGELPELARSIAYLWYTGSWPGRPGEGETFVVSSQAYVQGLVWAALGGRAPGTAPAVAGR